jgi:hypothetical protein
MQSKVLNTNMVLAELGLPEYISDLNHYMGRNNISHLRMSSAIARVMDFLEGEKGLPLHLTSLLGNNGIFRLMPHEVKRKRKGVLERPNIEFSIRYYCPFHIEEGINAAIQLIFLGLHPKWAIFCAASYTSKHFKEQQHKFLPSRHTIRKKLKDCEINIGDIDEIFG